MVMYITCLTRVKWHEMLKSTMQPDVVSVHRNLEMVLNVEIMQRIVKSWSYLCAELSWTALPTVSQYS